MIYKDFVFYLTIFAFSTAFLTFFRFAFKLKDRWFFRVARDYYPLLLSLLLLRAFVIEPFRIPSGSMEPTLLNGDIIVVNKFIYGLRLPITGNIFLPVSSPKPGDVIVFRYPKDPTKLDFIKRVVGAPGDKIAYRNGILYRNGIQVPNIHVSSGYGQRQKGEAYPLEILKEHISLEKNYSIQLSKDQPFRIETSELIVPNGHYFVLGDNRDNSQDSRFWGFVPENLIIGKAFAIWMSFEPFSYWLRLNRIGWIH